MILLSDSIESYVKTQPHPILTSGIENFFMALGFTQKSILGAVGFLRSQNRIGIINTVLVNKRVEHLFF